MMDELLACRDLRAEEARVTCYDSVVDRSRHRGGQETRPATPTPMPARTEAAAPATMGTAGIMQEDLFGKSGDEVQRTVEEVTGSQRIESLSAQVTKLQPSGYDKVFITLDNGQIWQQIDSSYLRLKVGDNITVERATLGSFLLQKIGSNRTMRVTRRN